MTGPPGALFRALRVVFVVATIAWAVAIDVALGSSMTEYPVAAAMVTVGLLAVGVVALVWWIVRRMRSARAASALVSVLLVLLLLPPGSAMRPGGITHARFGLTVVGLLPVPLFDVTIRSDGRPGLRDKTHRVTLDEARGMVDAGTEVLIIANGWDGVVWVDPGVLTPGALPAGVVVEVLRTGEAVRRYRHLRREGRRVALLLHSTCWLRGRLPAPACIQAVAQRGDK